MKPPFRLLCAALLFAALPASAQTTGDAASADKNPKTTLPARLYSVVGALGNEGFKLRDGAWTGSIEGSKPQRLAVNLFAGNQYWFSAATSGAGEAPDLVLRDPSGNKMQPVTYEGSGVAAVGVTAPVTGRYIIELSGSAAGSRDFCLFYLFK